MEKPKNKCFIYHKNGIIQSIDQGSFCDLISESKLDILLKLRNEDLITVNYKDITYNVIDFWFTDSVDLIGHNSEYHIKVTEDGH